MFLDHLNVLEKHYRTISKQISLNIKLVLKYKSFRSVMPSVQTHQAIVLDVRKKRPILFVDVSRPFECAREALSNHIKTNLPQHKISSDIQIISFGNTLSTNTPSHCARCKEKKVNTFGGCFSTI
jgi:uncharacterized protein YejL (UPF0352 family)